MKFHEISSLEISDFDFSSPIGPELTRRHGLCGFSLGFSVVRVVKWRPYATVYQVFVAIIHCVIIPIWVVWLGAQLRRASAGGGMYAASVERAGGRGEGAEMAPPRWAGRGPKPTPM